MSLLLSIFLGLKGLAILIGTMISTGGGGTVSVEVASVELKTDTAWVEVKVNGIYSEELNDFLESGTPIPLILEASLKSEKHTALSKTRINLLKYDLEQKRYLIVRSGDTLRVQDKEEAKRLFPIFEVALFSARDLREDGWYQIKINCRLGKVKLDILNMKDFDLMSLWNFKTPGLETSPFRKRDLETANDYDEN